MALFKSRFVVALVGLVLALGITGDSLAAIDLTNTIPSPQQIGNLPTSFDTVATLVALVFNVVIAISGSIFLILLLAGGVVYLTAAGNEESTTKARRIILDAIVGLVLVLAAYAIGIFILGRLGYRNANVPQFNSNSGSSGIPSSSGTGAPSTGGGTTPNEPPLADD